MVTFYENNPCEREQLLPACSTMVKCYGRRLVINADACNISQGGVFAWVYDIFGSTTVLTVEDDTAVHVYGTGGVLSLESSTWNDRWWPVSSRYGIGAVDMWSVTTGSNNTVIAVLDTGIVPLAIPLFASIADGYDFISDISVSNDGDGRDVNWEDPGSYSNTCPDSTSWHGTHMAAIMAGSPGNSSNSTGFQGIATGVTLMPIRVLGLCESGRASDVADAIVWASGGVIDNMSLNPKPVNIISMSFSGLGGCPSYLQSAVTQARAAGCVLVAAAGNNAASMTEYFPGNCAGVVSVQASTRSGVLASYSNTHGTLAAPGGDTEHPVVALSLSPDGSEIVPIAVMGTSVSVSIVAGFVALGLDIYGPSFNLGNTIISFSDTCVACGAGIVSYHGDYAVLVVDHNLSQYTCSNNALEVNNTYTDQSIRLDPETTEWISNDVACDPKVHAASLTAPSCMRGQYIDAIGLCEDCPLNYTCLGNSFMYDEVVYPRFPITNYGENTVDGVTVNVTASWNIISSDGPLFMDKNMSTTFNHPEETYGSHSDLGNSKKTINPKKPGEWIKIDFGEAFVLSMVRFLPSPTVHVEYNLDTSHAYGLPYGILVFATNNDNQVQSGEIMDLQDYTQISINQYMTQRQSYTFEPDLWFEYLMDETVAYRYYVIVMERVWNNRNTPGFLRLCELELTHVNHLIDAHDCSYRTYWDSVSLGCLPCGGQVSVICPTASDVISNKMPYSRFHGVNWDQISNTWRDTSGNNRHSIEASGIWRNLDNGGAVSLPNPS